MVQTLDESAISGSQTENQVTELCSILTLHRNDKGTIQVEKELKAQIIAILKGMPQDSKLEFMIDGQLVFSITQRSNHYEYVHELGESVQQVVGTVPINHMIKGMIYYLVSYLNNKNTKIVYTFNP